MDIRSSFYDKYRSTGSSSNNGGQSRYGSGYGLPPRTGSSSSGYRRSNLGSLSLGHSSYRILSDNEDKYICEVPVDPIFMLHTDKIAVKVLKNTVTITSNVLEKKKNEFGNEVNQDWKLNKRVTLPEDCNLDTIDVVCDKKKTIVRIQCDKIEGHTRCMSRESRIASRAGSRNSSAMGYTQGGGGGYHSGYQSGFQSGYTSGYMTPNFYNRPDRPDSRSSNASNLEDRLNAARQSVNYQASLCKELKTIEDSNTRWEAHFPLEDSFVGNPSSVRVFKKNSNIIIEKKVPIPNEVQLATVSAYMKDNVVVMNGSKRPQSNLSQASHSYLPPESPSLSIPSSVDPAFDAMHGRNQAEIHKEMLKMTEPIKLPETSVPKVEPMKPDAFLPSARTSYSSSSYGTSSSKQTVNSNGISGLVSNGVARSAPEPNKKPAEEPVQKPVESDSIETERRSILKTPTSQVGEDRMRKLSSSSSVSQKRVTMSEDVNQENDSDEEPMCEVIEDSNSKWCVRLSVPEVFIAKPDSIKVKVSKKTIMIRSTVDEGGRSSTLKREVKIPDGVNQKTLSVEAIKDKKCLILRCNKVQ